MIKSKKNLALKSAVAMLASLPMLAMATNGMNSEGFGPKDRGMGGAGVARATETQSIVNNPAAVTAVGNRQDIALGLFSPNSRGFTVTGNNLDPDGPGAAPAGPYFDQTQTSKKNLFPIPYYGYSKQMDDGAAWAFTVSALGGMNTDYADNFGAGLGLTGRTGINLAQMFFGGTYGAKLANDVSWGVTVSLDYQQFEAEGLEAFGSASSDATKLTNNGTDTSTGIGIKLGLRGELGNGGSWGASYRLKSDMSEFDDYAGLFADQGDLDIAPTFTLGIAMPIAVDTILALDYHYIDYEAVGTVSNPTSLVLTGGQFGDSGGPGFGWESISVIKAGIETNTSPDMIWRFGLNVGESPLAKDEFSTAFLVPATVTTHLTVGFTKQMDANSELTAVWVHTLNESESAPFSPAFGGGTLEAEMEQNFIEVSYGMLF
jgi:long-chain fatty acid transport protein